MAAVLPPFRSLPSDFRTALHAFAQSSSTFRIVRTVRSDARSAAPASPSDTSPPPERLYVLDSSFNPPTLGHLHIVLSALRDDVPTQPKHVLLLLATQNADKAPKPAAFEQRLTMMSIMAEDILSGFRSDATPHADVSVSVSVGVTKWPYVIDKSYSIAGKDTGSPFPFPPTQQVHLSGYDTFIRMMDTKYYPPDHTLTSLAPFFANHSLRVTFRTGDKYGTRETQEQYLKDLAGGKREAEAGKPEWAEKVQMVQGRNDEMVTSSTKAREGVQAGDERIVGQMCGPRVARWALEEGLYRDEHGTT